MKKLLIIGGGHAHVEVLRQLALQRPGGVAVTLVSPDRHTPYSGMLPGLIAGHYTFEQCHIDLQPLAQAANARFVLAHARKLDATRQTVTLDDGSELHYDLASIDVGSVPLAQHIPGVAQHAIAVKPVREFLLAWDALQTRVRAGDVRAMAVVGGGAAGVEVLLAMHYRLGQSADVPPGFSLITDTPQLLPQHPRAVRVMLERNLARKHVQVHRALRVTRVERDALIAIGVSSNAQSDPREQALEQRVSADAVVWVTGAAPPAWLADSGLALNDRKFLNINKYLQSSNQPNVFAAGDCATVHGAMYPKSGVYAVRQGPVLAANLLAALRDARAALQTYTPQPRALALISTGEQHAIASWGALAWQGDWVWRWKDRIDRGFMGRYRG